MEQNLGFRDDQQIQTCVYCGKDVDVRTDEWNGDYQNIGHRLCTNQQVPSMASDTLSFPDMMSLNKALKKGWMNAQEIAEKYAGALEKTIDLAKEVKFGEFNWGPTQRRASYAANFVRRLAMCLAGQDALVKRTPFKSVNTDRIRLRKQYRRRTYERLQESLRSDEIQPGSGS